MEAAVKEEVSKYIEDNDRLKSAYHEHQSYGKKIAKMEKKRVLSTDDDIEMKRLKKLKLKKSLKGKNMVHSATEQSETWG